MSEPGKTHTLLRPLLWLRHRWQAALFAASLILLLGTVGLWQVGHFDQRRVVEWVGNRLGHEVEVGSFTLPEWRRVVVLNLRVGDFARIERLELTWSAGGIWGRTLDQLWVQGLEVKLGAMQEALAGQSGRNPRKKPSNLFAFTLKKLVIGQSRLILDNLGAGIPPLPVTLGDVTPMVFENLHLGGANEDPQAQAIQIAVIENITLYSPYDASAPVLAFEKVRVGFSWAGIQENQLDQLVFEEPTIYIGPDLFWFSDRMKEASAKAEEKVEKPKPWTIANFRIIQGGLVLSRDGQPALRLPLTFETEQSGMVLSDFGNLQLSKARFIIPTVNLPYPEYNLSITGMEGELFFSLPLEERGTRDLSNITPSLKIKSAVWKGLTARDIAISVTFDRKGIYGMFYGKAYEGSLEGGVTILLDEAMTWEAWASTTAVELKPVTQLLSPEHFVMEGVVDSAFSVKASSKTIRGFTGTVDLNRPGTMTITAVDRVVKDLPEDWHWLKRELSRVSLEAFRDYQFTGGSAKIDYAPPLSTFVLALDGAQGKRNFNLTWEDKGLMAIKSQIPTSKSQENAKTEP
jgi:hypothetical protein